MYPPIAHDRRFLIQPRAATAEHLLDKRPPAHVAAPLLRQRIIVNRPAITPLQHGVAGGGFGVFHHLRDRLAAAERADADMHRVVFIEHPR